MLRVMSLHQLAQTKVARDFSHNIETTLMFYMISLHSLIQTMVARELSLNGEVTMVATELSRKILRY